MKAISDCDQSQIVQGNMIECRGGVRTGFDSGEGAFSERRGAQPGDLKDENGWGMQKAERIASWVKSSTCAKVLKQENVSKDLRFRGGRRGLNHDLEHHSKGYLSYCESYRKLLRGF